MMPARHNRLNATLITGMLGWSALCALIVQGHVATTGMQGLWQADIEHIVLYFSVLPRFAMAAIAGAILGLAGFLLQQATRNPLASPMTLGVASGARLALILSTLFAPVLLVAGTEWVAFAGALLGIGLVFLLTWRKGLAPHTLVLAGLVVNVFVGALAAIFLLFHSEALNGVLWWGSGALDQQGWSDVLFLTARLLLALPLTWLLLRPLDVMRLHEAGARSLGVKVGRIRLASVAMASYLTACVISVVGIIGFVGLAAPALARILGASTLRAHWAYAMMMGALLTLLADAGLTLTSHYHPNDISTGAVTAVLGAPVLIWLALRERTGAPSGSPPHAPAVPRRLARPARALLALALMVGALALLGMVYGHDAQGGWVFVTDLSGELLALREPRVLTAVGAGIILGVAGVLLQRSADNPMAAPELLGITSGTGIGVLLAILTGLSATRAGVYIAGFAGALGALCLVVLANLRNRLDPEKVLLTGLAVAALLDTLQTIALVSGDPRGQQVLAWLSGSTYMAPAGSGYIVLAAALLVLAAACLLSPRILAVLGLGDSVGRALGLNIFLVRSTLLASCAALTAAATFMVGPLTFIGLMAPHMARMLGFASPSLQLPAAALVGAGLMTLADFLGRQLLFPYEIPSGLLATVMGGGYFLWMMYRDGD